MNAADKRRRKSEDFDGLRRLTAAAPSAEPFTFADLRRCFDEVTRMEQVQAKCEHEWCCKEGRRAVGIELKESYFRTAVRNMLRSTDQQGLFAGVACV